MSPRTPTSITAAGSTDPAFADSIVWSDTTREAMFCTWLERMASEQGIVASTLRAASADASFRRYFRVDLRRGSATCAPPEVTSRIVMDAPPQAENSEPFVRVASVMAEAGLNVPRVLNWDQQQGFMLLSDLGSRTMMEEIRTEDAGSNQSLYLEAVDSLIRWQLASRPGVLPIYDESLLRRELALFPQWYLERYRSVALSDAMRATLEKTFSLLAANNLRAPSVFVHADYMPRNLMVCGQEVPSRGMGILDFQDAVYGPITYDIASLMRDAFLSWEEDFVLDITIRYWEKARKAGLPVGDDFGEFYRGVEWMGLQRHLRIAGVFARLTLRDGKPKYLADAPRFIGYIRATAARYRELTPLLRLIDQVERIETVTGYSYGRL